MYSVINDMHFVILSCFAGARVLQGVCPTTENNHHLSRSRLWPGTARPHDGSDPPERSNIMSRKEDKSPAMKQYDNLDFISSDVVKLIIRHCELAIVLHTYGFLQEGLKNDQHDSQVATPKQTICHVPPGIYQQNENRHYRRTDLEKGHNQIRGSNSGTWYGFRPTTYFTGNPIQELT